MFAFMPTGLAPLEVVTVSALCAVTALSVATSIAVTVAYLATRPRQAVRHAAPAHAPQARPIETFPPVVAVQPAAG